MTCGVINCEEMDIATLRVTIKTESGDLKEGDVRVCSEHEKQMKSNQQSKEGFYN